MDQNDAKLVFNGVVDAAIKYRRDIGEVPLTFMLVMAKEHLIHLATPPDMDPRDMAETIRQAAGRSGARYAVSVGEAWMSVWSEDHVADHPEQVDVIMATIDGPDLQLCAVVEVFSDGSVGDPVFGVEGIAGHFTNLSGMVGIN